jgi:hypothetical protein
MSYAFKLGDRVRVIRIIEDDYAKPTLSINLLGATGIITWVGDKTLSDTPYEVKLDTIGYGKTERFNEVELELE